MARTNRPTAPRSRFPLRARWLALALVPAVAWLLGADPAHPVASVATAPARVGVLPAQGTRLAVEPTDDEASVDELIVSSERSVEVAIYELADPRIEALLVAAHRRGVAVRVLLDRAGAGFAVNAGAFAELTRAGVAVRWARPDEVLHEKCVVVDGSLAAVMTGNLVATEEDDTRDLVVVTSNSSAVVAIESTFVKDWEGSAVDSGTPAAGLVWSPGAEPVLAGLIDGAHRSIELEAEEMDAPAVIGALERAARRGVRVEVVMSADREWDAAFAALAAAGVRVDVVPSSPTCLYIHAKVVVVDDRRAFVGSENLSDASLWYDRELGVITQKPAVVATLLRTIGADRACAESLGRTRP